MTTIGETDTSTALSPSHPSVTLTGNHYGYAAVAQFYGTGQNLFAAIYAPKSAGFNILNTGHIESNFATSLDAGLLLGNAGIVTNEGIIQGGSGLIVFGPNPGSYIDNTKLIFATSAIGIYSYAEAGIRNTGSIGGVAAAIFLNNGGVINNGGAIIAQTGIASTYALTALFNTGLIRGQTQSGVYLDGSITNTTGAFILGGGAGIDLADGGAVTNAGLINGYADAILAASPATATAFSTNIANTGSINGGTAAIAIELGAPTANIYNAATGRITGAHYGIAIYTGGQPPSFISIGNAGYIEGAAGINEASRLGNNVSPFAGDTAIVIANGYVTNTGTIQGGANAIYAAGAVKLLNTNIIAAPGDALEFLTVGTIQNDGFINGGETGIFLNAGILTNSGAIASNQTAIAVRQAANIANKSTGTISGEAAVYFDFNDGNRLTNDGVIRASFGNAVASHFGLSLINTGTISSQISSSISGAVAIGGPGYIVNTGTIAAPNAAGIAFQSGALYNYGLITGNPDGIVNTNYERKSSYLYNAGQISAGIGGVGIQISSPGSIVNGASGTIDGNIGVSLAGANSLYNHGLIAGGVTTTGQYFGYIYNDAGGTIAGSTYGIVLSGPGYVYNAGMIAGSRYAITFRDSSEANGLVLTPTATFAGKINLDGGTVAIENNDFQAYATINLNQIVNATRFTIGAGIDLTFANAVTIASTLAIFNDEGTIISPKGVPLTIDGLITSDPHFPGQIWDSGTLTINGPVEPARYGKTAVYQYISQENGSTLNLGDPQSFNAKFEVFNPGDTIDLTNIALSSIVAATYAHGTLTIADTTGSFSLNFDNAGIYLSGDTVSLFADGAGTGITLAAPTPSLKPAATPIDPSPSSYESDLQMTEIGSTRHLVILNPNAPGVTLKGTIDATAPIANYITYQPGLPPFYKSLTAAVFAPSSASFTIINKGTLISDSSAATNAGIILAGRATLTNKNLIEGANGVLALAEKNDKLINKGTIIGTIGNGAYFYNAGNIDNSGRIVGNAYGVYIVGAAGGGTSHNSSNVNNTGTIIGKAGISSYYGPTQIYNSGKIEATDGYGVILRGTITNAASGVVSGTTGIYLRGGSDVKNEGLIAGKAYGVYFLSAGTIHNDGLITGATALSLYYGHSRVENAGTISASTGYGVIIHGAITNAATGTISGNTGLDLLANSNALNQGLIAGKTTGVAIAKSADGTAANLSTTLNNAGTINGATAGIVIDTPAGAGSYTVSLYNGPAGLISGNIYGIDIESSSATPTSIGNAGNIEAPTGTDAILMRGGQLTNTGIILGGATGVDAIGAATILNTNLIDGAATAILLNGNGAIQNSGHIAGGAIGVSLQSANASIANHAGGTIAGGTIGVSLSSSGYETIYNAGLIAGGTDAIIGNAGSSNVLTLAPTATIQGAVKLFGDLTLAAGPTAGDIALSNFTHIRNLYIAQNATWNAYGSIAAAITNNGTLNLTPASSVTLGGALNGDGTIAIGENLSLDGAATSAQILFTATNQQLALADPSDFAATIQNFTTTDTIDLAGISLSNINGEHVHQNIVTLVVPGKNIYLTFAANSNFASETFSLFAEGAGSGITLSPATPAFVTPASTTNALTTAVPNLNLSYTSPSTPASPATLTHTAALTHNLFAPTQPLLITLQS